MTQNDPYGVARQAIVLMQENRVMMTPENFTLWYGYCAGGTRGLTDAIDGAIAADIKFTDTFNEDLYSRFIGKKRLDDAVFDTTTRVSQELGDIMKFVQEAGDNTKAFGDTLQGVSGELGASHSNPDIFPLLLDKLAKATTHMNERTHALEERLQSATHKVQQLQTNLIKIRKEASTDSLTKLNNRKVFDEQLQRTVENARRRQEHLCMLFGDVDHFKQFNDTWGHHTGDQVLKLVARCIKENVRETDIPTRYGGEEFAILLPNTGLQHAFDIAEEIRKSVQSKKFMKRSTGQSLGTITMSFGAATYDGHEPPSEFVRRADACLYAAKHAGRNQVKSEADLDLNDFAKDAAARRSEKAAS